MSIASCLAYGVQAPVKLFNTVPAQFCSFAQSIKKVVSVSLAHVVSLFAKPKLEPNKKFEFEENINTAIASQAKNQDLPQHILNKIKENIKDDIEKKKHLNDIFLDLHRSEYSINGQRISLLKSEDTDEISADTKKKFLDGIEKISGESKEWVFATAHQGLFAPLSAGIDFENLVMPLDDNSLPYAYLYSGEPKTKTKLHISFDENTVCVHAEYFKPVKEVMHRNDEGKKVFLAKSSYIHAFINASVPIGPNGEIEIDHMIVEGKYNCELAHSQIHEAIKDLYDNRSGSSFHALQTYAKALEKEIVESQRQQGKALSLDDRGAFAQKLTHRAIADLAKIRGVTPQEVAAVVKESIASLNGKLPPLSDFTGQLDSRLSDFKIHNAVNVYRAIVPYETLKFSLVPVLEDLSESQINIEPAPTLKDIDPLLRQQLEEKGLLIKQEGVFLEYKKTPPLVMKKNLPMIITQGCQTSDLLKNNSGLVQKVLDMPDGMNRTIQLGKILDILDTGLSSQNRSQILSLLLPAPALKRNTFPQIMTVLNKESGILNKRLNDLYKKLLDKCLVDKEASNPSLPSEDFSVDYGFEEVSLVDDDEDTFTLDNSSVSSGYGSMESLEDVSEKNPDLMSEIISALPHLKAPQTRSTVYNSD